jgi:adenylosuccinate synthase
MRVIAVVGGQYGSEGKGVVSAHLARERDIDVCVRVGGPNAGHTISDGGRIFKLRQVPCGFVNLDCLLVLGPAAVISPDILLEEIEALERAGFDVWDRLKIDNRATIIGEGDALYEMGTIKNTIASVATGVGQARMHQLSRQGTRTRPSDVEWMIERAVVTEDVTLLYRGKVLLEGTQGFGLSLSFGRWPYVTSRDCTTAQLVNDCGLSPFDLNEAVMVCRTFPIRVGGPSGPMFNELTWEEVSRCAGRPVREWTSVSRTVRRVGSWDQMLFEQAWRHNRPTQVALMFCDYLGVENWGVEDMDDLNVAALGMIGATKANLVGTGRTNDIDDFTIFEI